MEIERDNLPAGRLPQTWNGADVLIIGVGAIVLFVVGVAGLNLLTNMFQPQGLNENGLSIWLSLGLGALEGIAIITSVYVLGLRRKKLDWTAVGLRFLPQGWVFNAFLISLIVIPLAGLIAAAIQLALGRPLENPQLPFLAPEGFSWVGAVGMLILGGIIAPFAEELFFRGILYQWLRSRWGIWVGILVSSIIFGAIHGEISVAGAAFVLGAILAWVYERSQSLWAPFLIHALNNSIKIVLLYAMLASGNMFPGV